MNRFLKTAFALMAAAALLGFVCYMLWPHSFAALQPDCDSITVFRIDTADDLSQTIRQETYCAGSAEFKQVMEILSRYSYRRSFRTLAGANCMEDNHAGYWLRVYLDHGDDREDFICGGTGEVSIDDLVWRIGYWGDRASLAMMQELSDILEQQRLCEKESQRAVPDGYERAELQPQDALLPGFRDCGHGRSELAAILSAPG